MDISANNEINFGRTVVDNVNLRKKALNGTYKLASATISKLEQGNPYDIKLINNVYSNWQNKTSFAKSIVDDFLLAKNAFSTYVVELKKSCFGLGNKICCMLETTNPQTAKSKDLFTINLLQSAPNIANKFKKSKIKGAGELCVYEAVKTAKKEGFKKVWLASANDAFYEKIGFDRVGNSSVFQLPAEKYDNFLNRIIQKYQLNK